MLNLNFLKCFNAAKVAVVLLIYVALAVSYSVVVPIGRGADEWAHYHYAQFIASKGRLPFNPAEREEAGYKSDWPPLYHAAVAGLTGWIETDGPPTFKYRADNTRRQLVPAQGPEAILHTEDELFPWQQEVLVWHLGRFLSIAFTAGALIVTYFLALDVFAGAKIVSNKVTRPTLALVSVAVLAFNPRFIFTGMVFGYDSLTLLVATLFLWLAVRLVKGCCFRWGFFGLGALAGLALTTKYLAALLPLEIVVVALLCWQAASIPSIRQAVIRLGQAALAYLVAISWWLAYLLINFNEIATYGPVLGTLAPLLRGDGSDRTVAELFARLSGGQAPPPAYIERQVYSAWQIITELPLTFWGNPVSRPYPLNWFVVAMTIVTVVAIAGLVLWWRNRASAAQLSRSYFILLVFHGLLAVPFMFIRLFGARDALEAVQGRHLLFLSGPALAMLLVWGLLSVWGRFYSANPMMPYPLRFIFSGLLGLLLVGAMSQLIYMVQVYPPLLPVQTTPYLASSVDVLPQINLNGQARLIDVVTGDRGQALQVDLLWRVDDAPFLDDYQMELALVDANGQNRSGWRAYQTQAHYPTRAWEVGDIVRDEGWLPLTHLPAGDYQIQVRFLGRDGAATAWQTVAPYTLSQAVSGIGEPVLWHNGKIAQYPVLYHARETVQLTGNHAADVDLVGPDGISRQPISAGEGWANFVVAADWPAGNYFLPGSNAPLLQVAPSQRNFDMPSISNPLDVNFAGNIKLLGYELPYRRVEPGQGLTVILYWQGLDWMGEEFVMFTRLLDNAQVAWGGRDRMVQENYSTLFWAPGEVIADPFAVQVNPAAPDGIYTLNLGWYEEVDGQAQSLPILNSETGEVTGRSSVVIGPVKVGGPPAGVTVADAHPQNPVNMALGEKIELLGFDATQTESVVELAFYWRALAEMGTDYTVFVHLRNSAGETAAQKDSPPVGSAYPTSLWDPGEIIRDEISVPVSELESGVYEVVVGMYEFGSGERLGVAGSSENTISLQSFEVFNK